MSEHRHADRNRKEFPRNGDDGGAEGAQFSDGDVDGELGEGAARAEGKHVKSDGGVTGHKVTAQHHGRAVTTKQPIDREEERKKQSAEAVENRHHGVRGNAVRLVQGVLSIGDESIEE